MDDGGLRFLEFPTIMYEADIEVDMILSYKWLVQYDLDIKSRRYGLQTNSTPQFFIPGLDYEEGAMLPNLAQIFVARDGLDFERVEKKVFHTYFDMSECEPMGTRVDDGYWRADQEAIDPLLEKENFLSQVSSAFGGL